MRNYVVLMQEKSPGAKSGRLGNKVLCPPLCYNTLSTLLLHSSTSHALLIHVHLFKNLFHVIASYEHELFS